MTNNQNSNRIRRLKRRIKNGKEVTEALLIGGLNRGAPFGAPLRPYREARKKHPGEPKKNWRRYIKRITEDNRISEKMLMRIIEHTAETGSWHTFVKETAAEGIKASAEHYLGKTDIDVKPYLDKIISGEGRANISDSQRRILGQLVKLSRRKLEE